MSREKWFMIISGLALVVSFLFTLMEIYQPFFAVVVLWVTIHDYDISMILEKLKKENKNDE
jgi:hypothetical protein